MLMDIKYFAKIFPKLTTDIKSKKLREHQAGKKIFNQDISYLNCCKPKLQRHPKKKDILPMEEQELQEPSRQESYKQKDDGWCL